MKPRTYLLTGLLLTSLTTEARRGGDEPRREWVNCHLAFSGVAEPQAATTADIEGGQALLRGAAQGASYVLSVRGKTAVARLILADGGPTLQANGSIELLRGGGMKATPQNLAFRRGDDDDRDDEVEREAGITLSYSATSDIQNPDIQLICESNNERI